MITSRPSKAALEGPVVEVLARRLERCPEQRHVGTGLEGGLVGLVRPDRRRLGRATAFDPGVGQGLDALLHRRLVEAVLVGSVDAAGDRPLRIDVSVVAALVANAFGARKVRKRRLGR